MALERFQLTDQVAVITGAGRGIGAASARVLAEAGADIVLASRTKDQLDLVADEVRAFGREALVVPLDVKELDRLVAETVDRFGRLDNVVNNAGGSMPRPFLDTSAGFMERAFHFNVTTAF